MSPHRRQAKQGSLASKEAEFHLALDNMPGALVHTDGDLNIVFCSYRFREMSSSPHRVCFGPGRPILNFCGYLAVHGYLRQR